MFEICPVLSRSVPTATPRTPQGRQLRMVTFSVPCKTCIKEYMELKWRMSNKVPPTGCQLQCAGNEVVKFWQYESETAARRSPLIESTTTTPPGAKILFVVTSSAIDTEDKVRQEIAKMARNRTEAIQCQESINIYIVLSCCVPVSARSLVPGNRRGKMDENDRPVKPPYHVPAPKPWGRSGCQAVPARER